MLEQAKTCQNETSATDKDINEMLEGAAPKTSVAECLHSCVLVKLGVVSTLRTHLKLRTDQLNINNFQIRSELSLKNAIRNVKIQIR